MKIGIIGAGNIGSALVHRFTTLGHDVAVANSRGPQSLAELAAATGAQPVSVREAAQDRDVVVVTIPEKNIPDLPADLFAGQAATVVIDTGNYYPRQRDGKIEAIEAGATESRWVQQHLQHPVVKAFNNIEAQKLLKAGQMAGSPGRIALPIAGDDEAAKRMVTRLIDELGFDAVDAGSIDDSWRQQPGTPVYGGDLDAAGVRRVLADAAQTRSPEWRAVTG